MGVVSAFDAFSIRSRTDAVRALFVEVARLAKEHANAYRAFAWCIRDLAPTGATEGNIIEAESKRSVGVAAVARDRIAELALRAGLTTSRRWLPTQVGGGNAARRCLAAAAVRDAHSVPAVGMTVASNCDAALANLLAADVATLPDRLDAEITAPNERGTDAAERAGTLRDTVTVAARHDRRWQRCWGERTGVEGSAGTGISTAIAGQSPIGSLFLERPRGATGQWRVGALAQRLLPPLPLGRGLTVGQYEGDTAEQGAKTRQETETRAARQAHANQTYEGIEAGIIHAMASRVA
jgi:hypothetical protein